MRDLSAGLTTMNRITRVGGVCALVAAVGAWLAPAVHAQTPTPVTITFKLTINGTAARGDSLDVSWGETGQIMCNAPCTGGGHSYVKTMTFPKGATETFVFTRDSGTAGTNLSRQHFAKQTVTANEDRSVSAVFDYGSSTTIAVPSTGSGSPVLLGAAITGLGIGLAGLGLRRRRHPPFGRTESSDREHGLLTR